MKLTNSVGEIRQTKQELNHEKDLCAEKDRQLANRKQEYEQRLLELKTTNDLALKDKVDQINKLEQKVARNEENRETLSARITSLTEQLAASKATKEQQAKQITYLEADKISLTADKETSKNEKMDLTRKIERLHCRSEDLDKDLKDLRKKHQDLENKETRGQAHTEQLETLIERAAAHRQLAQEAEQKFSDLQNSHAEELLAERNKHVTSTKDLETSHRKERGTLKTEMDTEKAKLTEVAEKYESLNTSLEHTRKQLAEKIDQGEELAKEITQLKTSVSEKESDLTTSKEGLQKAEETSLDLKNLCSTLQEELNQLGERYEELQSSTEEQISISQGDISRQQRKIFGLESRIQAGYSHNRAITQTCAVLLHETQRLSGLAAVATLSRARLREHNTEQQNYRNAIDKLLGEWQTYADGLQHSLDEANQKIASLQEDFELACSSRDQAMNDVKDVQEHRRINKAADDRSLKRLKEERKTLQASLEQKANEIEQHRMSMAKDIEEHQAQIAEIKAENDKLQEEARQATELHGSLSRNILKLRDERQNLLTALTEKTEEFERKNRESGNRATELEHKNTESANTIHRLREIQLPAYTTRIHNFENESENRMAKIRAAIGPPLEVDGETQIKDKHVDRETPQLDRLIKAKQTLDELYLQAQKQHTADAQTLKALEEQHDKLKAENVSMQQTYTSQIEWYGDRLRKWDGKLREVRDEYDQYRRDVLAFKQQVEARRQVTDADLDALIGYFNDRRQGLDTAFPELKAKTHKAWTEPLPNV
jgi:chromosome segregation ATPase